MLSSGDTEFLPGDFVDLLAFDEKNGEVLPIEVKAGNTSSASLNSFISDYKPSIAFKLVNGNLGFTDGKLTLPHYMVMFL